MYWLKLAAFGPPISSQDFLDLNISPNVSTIAPRVGWNLLLLRSKFKSHALDNTNLEYPPTEWPLSPCPHL